jgi:hypothetical protein
MNRSTRFLIQLVAGGLLVTLGAALLPGRGVGIAAPLVLMLIGFGILVQMIVRLGTNNEREYLKVILMRGEQIDALTSTIETLVENNYDNGDLEAMDLRMKMGIVDGAIADQDEDFRRILKIMDGPWWKPPNRRLPKTTPAQESAS